MRFNNIQYYRTFVWDWGVVAVLHALHFEIECELSNVHWGHDQVSFFLGLWPEPWLSIFFSLYKNKKSSEIMIWPKAVKLVFPPSLFCSSRKENKKEQKQIFCCCRYLSNVADLSPGFDSWAIQWGSIGRKHNVGWQLLSRIFHFSQLDHISCL